MLPDPFLVVNLRPEDRAFEEQMGSKDKAWYRIRGEPRLWLFKYSRLSGDAVVGEHWSEKLAAEIATLLGVPHARVELAELEGKPGSISERFPLLDASNAEMFHGNDLLADFLEDYDRERWHGQREHTISNIRAAIQRAVEQTHARARREYASEMPPEVRASLEEQEQDCQKESEEKRRRDMGKAEHDLAGLLILDAVILNTDRHHENWGTISFCDDEGEEHLWLAPSYDHASSLARNVSERQCAAWLADRNLDRVAWYAGRARGAVWLDARQHHGTNPLDLVANLHGRYPAVFRPWLDRVRSIRPEQVDELAQRIPDGMIGDATRRFVIALVHHTLTTLAKLP